MKITRLDLQNFKGFKEAHFEFNDQFNLVVGENGSGKSSLLDALAVAAGSFLLGVRGYDSRHIRPEDIRVESSSLGETPAPLPQYPVEVCAEGAVKDEQTLTGEWAITWKREISGNGGKTTQRDAKALKERAEKLVKQVQADKAVSLPVIAHYGAGRLWVPTRDMQGENIKVGDLKNPARLDAYTFCIDPRIKFTEIFAWLANEKYVALEQGYESEVFKIAKSAMARCVEGCSFLDYSVKEKDLFAAFEGRERLPFSMLSDGQRAMLSLVADIAIKAAILNPHKKATILEETSGVVLIDELDLHLHPKWQRQVVSNLKEIFPKIQFFASTHSPQVIGETPVEQIIVLRQDGSWFRPEASLGLNSNEVLRDIMEANYVSSAFTQQITELDDLLQEGEFEKAQEMIAALRKEFPNVPEFDRVEDYMTQVDELADEEA